MFLNSIVTFCCIVIVFLLGCSDKGDCGNNILKEIRNGNNSYKLVVFERDCGATTETSKQISILKSSESLTNHVGNVFVSDWMQLEAFWLDDSTAVIKMPKNRTEIFKKDTSSGRIRVKYE